MKTKELKNKPLLVLVQPSLYEKFREACDSNYKSLAEVIRDFMAEYVKNNPHTGDSK